MKSYIYGAQGIMDFMGMSSQFDRFIYPDCRIPVKNAHSEKNVLFLNSFHIRVEHIPSPGQLDSGDRCIDLA
jgi:hypothetical protein